MVTLDEIALAIKAEVDVDNFAKLDTFFTQLEKLRTRVETKKAQDAKAQHDAKITTAQSWFEGLSTIIDNPTTRDEAMSNFKTIEGLLGTETDRFRLTVLRKEKELANEKYKEVKANS